MRSLAPPVVRASRGRAEQQPTKYQQGVGTGDGLLSLEEEEGLTTSCWVEVCAPYPQGAMTEASSGVVEEDLVFRGVEFSVKVETENGLLAVEISDAKTADQWRGEFDPACIDHTPPHALRDLFEATRWSSPSPPNPNFRDTSTSPLRQHTFTPLAAWRWSSNV
ncbi:unnamed protein product [Boreogadus saida]